MRAVGGTGDAYLTTPIVDKTNTSNHCGLLGRRIVYFSLHLKKHLFSPKQAKIYVFRPNSRCVIGVLCGGL